MSNIIQTILILYSYKLSNNKVNDTKTAGDGIELKLHFQPYWQSALISSPWVLLRKQEITFQIEKVKRKS